MRRAPREEGARWLQQAVEDLRWAEDLAERGGYHIACFLAQQIGEKALKGFLYAQGEEIVIGHSVERLCRAAARYDPAFDQLVARWSILDGYYIPTRYPNSVPDSIPAHIFTRDAAGEAVRLAREIVTYVTDRLGRMEGEGGGG
ncbi:DNA-binding protein [Candidatus Methylomirabilis limnetica]|uniref:DNA-binding protein n=1 Tax=Candidatus Methylomirabilis limnetica TaxID=2033718 RepID=A0A2T4TZV4_9BACT|nr:HEPN domain-containing protein [Candidatus Methylomirabilis limnetica]PTL36657.1 DNA-binding protein [Candidatus Methylomirabilis limnetica]